MASKNDLDQAFNEIEEVFGQNRTIRREMIESLRKQASKMEISEYDKPMMVQAKLMIVKTLDDILKSDEDVSLKKIKMKMSRKDSETNGMVGASIVELLKSIRGNKDALKGGGTSEGVDHDEALYQLKELQQNNKKLEVLDGEIEACGSTPTTDGETPVAVKKDTKEEDDEE
jgi:hypothetical protein